MEMNKTTKVARQVSEGANHALEHFSDKLHKSIEQATDKASEIESGLSSRYASMKDSAEHGYDSAISTVRKHPVYTILGTAALGILAGVLIGRTGRRSSSDSKRD